MVTPTEKIGEASGGHDRGDLGHDPSSIPALGHEPQSLKATPSTAVTARHPADRPALHAVETHRSDGDPREDTAIGLSKMAQIGSIIPANGPKWLTVKT